MFSHSEDGLKEYKDILSNRLKMKMASDYKTIGLVKREEKKREGSPVEKSVYQKEIEQIEAKRGEIQSVVGKSEEKKGQIMDIVESRQETRDSRKELRIYDGRKERYEVEQSSRIGEIMQKQIKRLVKPQWQAPWVLERVICGHQGWVRSVDVDLTNDWLVSGGNDRCIKFWELATGTLKLSLTGHINTVRKTLVSNRHAYLYSCGEDKSVKCWDLEYNKVIRSYHGHLSGVYSLATHPTLDILASGGRDATIRLWDIRTRA